MRTYFKTTLALLSALFLVFIAACGSNEVSKEKQIQNQTKNKLIQLNMLWVKQRSQKLLNVLLF